VAYLATLPALNDDGRPGFSANDRAAPVVTNVALCSYSDLRSTADTPDIGKRGR
jgi:hypothetical protein